MPAEINPRSEQSTMVAYLRWLVILALVFVVGSTAFALVVLSKLDRVVGVVENVNAKVDRFAEAAAPLGKAAVDRGVDALEHLDTEDLGKSATEGVKEIGRAAKDKAIEAIRKRTAKEPAP